MIEITSGSIFGNRPIGRTSDFGSDYEGSNPSSQAPTLKGFSK